MATLVQKWAAGDGSLHETERAADDHDAMLTFHRWCSTNICVGGEWSATQVAREILTYWRVEYLSGPKREVRPTRTDQEIVDQTEELASVLLNWAFQMSMTPGVNHRDSDHPRANSCWRLACVIQEMLTNTDVTNAVANLE